MRVIAPLLLLAGWAAAQPPRLFFSDLESGPNSGGENNGGVYVTVWGRNFGAARGASRVTTGGGAAAAYPVWTDTRITFQPGAAAASGNIVVTTASGTSNGLPFTVRPGNIYFVSPSGNDAADGSFARPWRTLVKATETMVAGDTTYAMDGVSQTSADLYSAALSIVRGGAPGRPIALVAYPGATVTVGSPSLEFGMRIPNIDEAAVADHWVVSQLTLRGQTSALAVEGPNPSNWRVTGNNLSCPNGDGQTGCFAAALGSEIKVLGNEVHRTGRAGASKQYHAVYFTTDTNRVEAGWNYIHDNNTCRAIQFHSSPLCFPDCGPTDRTGFNQYDLSVHDNLIRGNVCDGINFATVDPSKGKVEAYNNVVVRAGAGPHPPDGSSSYACVYVAGGTNTGADGTGNVEVYNNTCYDFGAVDPSWDDAGAFVRGPGSPRLFMNLRNNIAYAAGRQNYVSGVTSLIRGSNNLWFGNGPGPGFLQNNVNADPRFAALAANDLRLQAGSPAIDAGVNTQISTDFNGIARPQGSAYDIGAFEYFQDTAPPPPAAPRINPRGIANTFSGVGGAVAPGEIVSIYGSGLGPAQGVVTAFDPASGRLPTSVAGVSVTLNGIAAPIYYARADQVNVQAPYELAGSADAAVVLTYGGVASSPERIAVNPTHPGLHPAVFNQDFSVNGPRNPVPAGGIVVLYATGQGVTTPPSVTGAAPAGSLPTPVAAVTLLIGGRPARLLFAGLIPGAAGVMQLNAVIPDGLAPGDAVPVVLRVGAAEAQPGVTLALR
ncbi:MAG: choice-of-anchor Q domain-containing protein [Acidobacteriota bacterium]